MLTHFARSAAHQNPRRLVAAVGAVAVLLSSPAFSARANVDFPPAQPPATVESAAPRVPDDVAMLADTTVPVADRRAAARRLLLADDPPSRRAVLDYLAKASADPDGPHQQLLVALASRTTAPAWLAGPLVDAARAALPRPGESLIAALATLRTQAAARALVDALGAATSSEQRSAAVAALRRMTGRELGDDHAAWAQWLADVEFLPELDWRQVLWEGLARRADEQARLADAAITRIIDAKRREFVDLPETGGARSLLLAALLVDELPPMRRLAVTLVQRELANGRRLDDIVVDSTVELLSDPSPELRASAANLLAALAPPQAGAVVADALAQEGDPRAAGAMLRALARWPSAQSAPMVLHWLKLDRGARAGAIDAAAAFRRAGLLTDPAERRLVAEALRQLPPGAMSDTSAWLLVQVGDQADIAYVAGWLKNPSAALRLRAAEAIASTVDGVDLLLAACGDDLALFPAAARAMAAHRATPQGFRQLAAIPAPDEFRTPGLRSVAAELAAGELVDVASALEPPTLREAILAPLAGQLSPSERRGLIPDKIRGIVLLARTRLALGQPGSALDALDALAPLSGAAYADTLASRATALLWLNRIPEAEKLDAPPSAWLDALEFAISQPHAREIAASIKTRFGAKLSTEQRERLAALVSRMPAG